MFPTVLRYMVAVVMYTPPFLLGMLYTPEFPWYAIGTLFAYAAFWTWID
jgi:hypothetical protein